jgi:hypothetical protein
VARGAKGHRWQAPGNREEKKEEDGSPIEPGMTNEDGSPIRSGMTIKQDG